MRQHRKRQRRRNRRQPARRWRRRPMRLRPPVRAAGTDFTVAPGRTFRRPARSRGHPPADRLRRSSSPCMPVVFSGRGSTLLLAFTTIAIAYLLVMRDADLRHQERVLVHAFLDPCAHEHARQQHAARVREHRADRHRAGGRPSRPRTAACRLPSRSCRLPGSATPSRRPGRSSSGGRSARPRSFRPSRLDCVRSTYTGSSCCTVDISVAWLACTYAPGVTCEMPTRPVIGDTTSV